MASINFNPATVEPAKPLEPIPSGKYAAMMTDSDCKPNSKGTGLRMPVTFQILDGEFKGRKVFDGLNIQHENPVAQQIGQEQLSAICHAVGHLGQLEDTSQLHGKPLLLTVGFVGEQTDAATGKTYKAKNEINGYEPLAGAAPAGGAPASAAPAWAQQQAPPQQPAAAPVAQQPAPVAQPAPQQQPAQQQPAQPAPAQPWEQPAPAQPAQQAAPAPAQQPASAPQQPAAAPATASPSEDTPPWAR